MNWRDFLATSTPRKPYADAQTAASSVCSVGGLTTIRKPAGGVPTPGTVSSGGFALNKPKNSLPSSSFNAPRILISRKPVTKHTKPLRDGDADHTCGMGAPLVRDVPPAGNPIPPLHPGWQLGWRDHDGRLWGGWDDPAHGTIASCTWTGSTWRVILTTGTEVPLSRIVGVRKMNHAGECVGVWTTRAHGLDGEGRAS